MKLDDDYSQIRTNILMMDDLPNASQIYRLLMQEHRHKEISKVTTIPTESVAFFADKRKFYDKSYKHGSHSSPGGKCNTYFCEHCKISRHSIERCFKIHGYPNSNKTLPNKKFAATVTSLDTPAGPNEATQSGFTPTQYNTLLMLLGKKDNLNEKEFLPTDPTAPLAGRSCHASFTCYALDN